MANSTVVYTTALTRFTIGRRAFSTDTINVYYSTNTTSPAPADVLTGAVLVDPGAYTVEGIGARADAFVIDWPAAPTSGTLIVDVESAIGRISNFPDNQLPSGAALNREFDHIITLTGDNATDITALDVRVTANEGDITALDGRLTTAEGDITTAEADIDALEAWRAGTVDPTLTSHGNRLTTVEGRATALENNALLESGGVFNAENKRIANAADPASAQDVATAKYVDDQVASVVVGAGAVPPPGAGFTGKVLTALGAASYGWVLPVLDATTATAAISGVLADSAGGAEVAPGLTELSLAAGTYYVEGSIGYVVDVADPAAFYVAVYVADDPTAPALSTPVQQAHSAALLAAGVTTTLKALGQIRASGLLVLAAPTTLKLCYSNAASAGTAKALGSTQLPAQITAIRIA